MPEKPYEHIAIELKWHDRWANAEFYKAEENSSKPKFYVLEMLPYPSGTLHIGHIRNYSIGDALARYKWMRGFNVLHPMGWDAFGLPAENAAIANKVPPRQWTLQNIAAMKKTHRRFAFSYDWDREVSTCEPEYYRWNQWFFLQMLERGLAYRKKALVNWCPKCATVLANEQVVEGCCWRHEDTPVEQRALEQWFLKITDYAVNPFSGGQVPIWVGNFVLMGYGTGAIMAVPAHDERDFEFCRKYGIAVRPVIRPVDGELAVEPGMTAAFPDYGIVENSGPWS